MKNCCNKSFKRQQNFILLFLVWKIRSVTRRLFLQLSQEDCSSANRRGKRKLYGAVDLLSKIWQHNKQSVLCQLSFLCLMNSLQDLIPFTCMLERHVMTTHPLPTHLVTICINELSVWCWEVWWVAATWMDTCETEKYRDLLMYLREKSSLISY